MSSAKFQALVSQQRPAILFLVKAAPIYIPTGLPVNVYFSEKGFTTRPDETVVADRSRHFDGVLKSAFFYQRELWSSGTIGGTSEPHNGSIELINLNGDLDAYGDPTLYYWPGTTVTAMAGGKGFLYSEFETIFSGSADRWSPGTQLSHLEIKDFQLLLQQGLALPRFRGMGKCIQNSASQLGELTVPGPAITTNGGIEFWFRWRAGQVLCRDNTSASGVGCIPILDASGLVSFRWNGVTVIGTMATSALRDTKWHHVHVRKTAGLVEQLIDGALHVSTSGVSNTANALPWHFLSNGPIAVGAGADADIDEVRIWTNTRTNDEINVSKELEISDNPLPAILGAYLKLNGNVTDSTTNGNNGTLTSTTGTGGAIPIYISSGEGGPELAGLTKPACFGEVFEVSGVQDDPAAQTWTLHFGPINDVVECFDNGNALTLGTGWTKDITNGKATILNAISKTGPITFHVQGDKPAGGIYATTFAQLLRRWMTLPLGPVSDPAGLDTAAFTAADAANSAPLGIYIPPGDRPQILTLTDQAAQSVGGIYWFKRNGLATVNYWTTPSGSPVLVLQESQGDIISIDPIDLDPPGWYYTVGYAQNWNVRDKGTEAGAVQGTTRQAFLENQFRWAPKFRTRASYEQAIPEQRVGSLHVAIAGATAEATRRLGVYGAARRGFTIVARAKPYLADVGDVVQVYHSRHGLSGGVLFRILSMQEDKRSVTMEVWR